MKSRAVGFTRWIVCCALLWLCGCQTTPYAIDDALLENPRDPGIVSGELDNGFRYYLRSTNGAERDDQIELRLIVRAGSLSERPGEEGYSHLLEHVVLRGTKSFQYEKIDALLEQNGLVWGRDVNATTHYNATIFRFSLSENERHLIPQIIALYAEILDSVRLDKRAVDAEKKIVEAEWVYRFAHKAYLVDPIATAAYAGSSYANRPPAGKLSTIRSATTDSLKAYWQRAYTPENSAVVITGSIVPWELEPLVVSRFNRLQKRPGDNLMSQTVHSTVSADPAFLSYTDPDSATDEVSINLISRDHDATSDNWMSERYLQALVLKSISRMMGTYLPSTDCGKPEFAISLLDNGQSAYRIATTVGNKRYETCMNILVSAFHKVLRYRVSTEEYALLQHRFRQLAIEEGNLYRAGNASTVADRISQSVTLGADVLPAALYESHLLEAIDRFNLSAFAAVRRNVERDYRVVYSAVSKNETPVLSAHAVQQVVRRAGSIETELPAAIRPDYAGESGNISKPVRVQYGKKQILQSGEKTQWLLENGTRVIFFEDNRYDYLAIAMAAAGGYRAVSADLAAVAEVLPLAVDRDVVQMKTSAANESPYSLESTVFVNPTSHGVLAYASSTDASALFSHLADHFKRPQISRPGAYRLSSDREYSGTSAAYSYWMQGMRSTKPDILTKAHFRSAYQQLFYSPHAFTVIVVGNSSADEIQSQLNKVNFSVSMQSEADNVARLQSVSIPVQDTKFPMGDRVEVSWYHQCRVHSDETSDSYLRLLTHVVESRIRHSLRENHGLTYEPEVHLLSDTQASNERIHSIRYTVHREHLFEAKELVSSILNRVGLEGITQSEFRLAIIREHRRQSELRHDYLAFATEQVLQAVLDGSSERIGPEKLELTIANRVAGCFSSANATVSVQEQGVGNNGIVSSRPR